MTTVQSTHTCICPNGHQWTTTRVMRDGLYFVGVSSETCKQCGEHPNTFVQSTPPWTSEKPTKPGWYWYQDQGRGKEIELPNGAFASQPVIARVSWSEWEGSAVLDVKFWGDYTGGGLCRPDILPGEWAGPIDPPQ